MHNKAVILADSLDDRLTLKLYAHLVCWSMRIALSLFVSNTRGIFGNDSYSITHDISAVPSVTKKLKTVTYSRTSYFFPNF